uniref:Uncharacterized protein n=1 Tax=Oreochromis niloticus TaxID=8128 RepID=A0A669BS35_ORENI
MKFVMLFLVLSLVVLMAEPGECSFKRFKSFLGGVKAAFRGAKTAWKGKSILINVALYLFCLFHIRAQKLRENEQQVTNCDQAVHFVDFIYLKPKVCKRYIQS